MRETRLESVLALRRGAGLPAPVAANLVARVAALIAARPRVVSVAEVRVREDGEPKLVRREGPPPMAYRAPEIVDATEGDPRAAVFGLGVLLVHVALGRSPFERMTDVQTRLAVGEEPLPMLTDRAAQASPDLDAIVANACAKDPTRRYPSPAALAEALEEYLENELHEAGLRPIAAAVRDAVEHRPSHDRSSMPDYDSAELALTPANDRPPSGPVVTHSLDESIERIGDPLATGAGGAQKPLTELDVDLEVVARAEKERVAKTVAPIRTPARGPNWMARIGIALGVLLVASLIYRFLVAPLLE